MSNEERRIAFKNLCIDLRVYRLNAIKKSVYKFANEAHLVLTVKNETHALVQYSNLKADLSDDLFSQNFFRDLMDQELRLEVAEKTANMRDLILAHAYVPISLTCPEANTDTWEKDPLNVQVADRHSHLPKKTGS